MLIVSKNTGDDLTSSEFNQIPDELENIISSAGITPSDTDLNQIAKSMSQHASDSDFYSTGGTANAIVLSAQSPRKAPPALSNGFRARFIASDNNTDAVTVNVGGLGVKDIVKNGFADPLSADDIIAGNPYELIYSTSSGKFNLINLNLSVVTTKLSPVAVDHSMTSYYITDNQWALVDTTAGAVTVILPVSGKCRVKWVAGSTAPVINGTIDGSTNLTMDVLLQSLDFESSADNTWWRV